MPKKVLVVYYTQTGQLRSIVDSITSPLMSDGGISVTFEELKPKPAFPFPWSADQFFQAMPESVKGIPCELEPLSVKGSESFDLVIIAWQPWFLSPSIPIHAFFQHPDASLLLSGKPVITVIGSRNMWINAHKTVKEYIRKAGGILKGNVIMYDKSPNLLSIISVIRWLILGKQEKYLIFPRSGVSDSDIQHAAVYGKIIAESLKQGNFDSVNTKLIEAGAADVKTNLVMLEKRGIVFFRIWASFIMKKGAFGNPERLTRVRMFKYYLLTVLYLVSPFASVLYHILKPFRKKTIKKQISFYQSV